MIDKPKPLTLWAFEKHPGRCSSTAQQPCIACGRDLAVLGVDLDGRAVEDDFFLGAYSKLYLRDLSHSMNNALWARPSLNSTYSG